MKNCIIVCLLVHLISSSRQWDHIECLSSGGGGACKHKEKLYLRQDEKKWILNFLNDYRNNVARGGIMPLTLKAGNIMKLVWKIELARLAKNKAYECWEGLHDTCRTARDGQEFGQNSYIGTYKKTGAVGNQLIEERNKRIKMMVETWFSEIKSLKDSDIHSYSGNRTDIANITQIIWAETTYMGCGYAEFSGTDDLDLLFFSFICYFQPKGNIPSKAIFLEGNPCSICPKGSNCSLTVQNLCFNGVESEYSEDPSGANSCKPSADLIILCVLALLPAFGCPMSSK